MGVTRERHTAVTEPHDDIASCATVPGPWDADLAHWPKLEGKKARTKSSAPKSTSGFAFRLNGNQERLGPRFRLGNLVLLRTRLLLS
jgi:hypothetical protein